MPNPSAKQLTSIPVEIPRWIKHDFPAVYECLLEDLWEHDFERPTVQRARRQFNVRSLRLVKFQRTLTGFQIYGKIVGSQAVTYDTEVDFYVEDPRTKRFLLESWCSCPVGDWCKHAAAFLNIISKEIQAEERAKTADPDKELNSWLANLKAQTPEQQPVSTLSTKQELAPSSRFLFYCFEKDYRGDLSINHYVGQTNKAGKLKINFSSMAQANPHRPPKYMDESDIDIGLNYDTMVFNIQFNRESIFEHQGFPQFLEMILRTGRAITRDDNEEWKFLVEGPTYTPAPGWVPSRKGFIRPGLDHVPASFEGFTRAFKPTAPYFVDHEPDPARLCLIEFGEHSFEFLKTWLDGPEIAEKDSLKSAQALLNQNPALPLPVPQEPETILGLEPVAAIHLARARPPLSALTPATVALSFQYGDHQTNPGPTSDSFAAVTEKQVVRIERNPALEEEQRSLLLRELPLSPAPGSFLLAVDSEKGAEAWQTVLNLADDLRALAEANDWHLTIDPDCDLTLETIPEESLTTGLTEDSSTGIDWFQFQASWITPEGTEKSLLPFLSLFIKQLNPDEVANLLESTPPDDQTVLPDPADQSHFLSFPTRRLLDLANTLFQLFGGIPSEDEPLHRLQAAALAHSLELDSDQTLKDLAQLGRNLSQIEELPQPRLPKAVKADLRAYQLQGFHWMQFLARHSLHGILADDMGLGKTLQSLAHLQAEVSGRRTGKKPSLVLAPTSVISNWQREAQNFTPNLKTLLLHGPERHEKYAEVDKNHLVITSYPLLVRDFKKLGKIDFHLILLDEAQYIKNPAAKVSQAVCKLKGQHRLSLSGTPLENHLGELWSQFRFLMPGLLGSSETFVKTFRTPIERHQDTAAQLRLNARVAPLILRRKKDEVATELPPKTEIVHRIALGKKQIDLYETVRAAMDGGIKEAISNKGLAKSQIVVLAALLRLRQICCHPQLIDLDAAKKVTESAKTEHLLQKLLPTLLEEGRKILIFSTFTKMLAILEKEFKKAGYKYSKITGATRKRDVQINDFQSGKTDLFLISLKAGGTGLNLTAADTVIHHDPWWNPAAENQATDRAYRIGQDKPVFVHKLIIQGSIEERILELQAKKSKIVEALLSDDTNQLKLDQATLSHLLAPLE